MKFERIPSVCLGTVCFFLAMHVVSPCYCQEFGRGQGQGMQGMSRHQGPPEEAFDACHGLNDGDQCDFQSPHGDVSGTCESHHNQIVCVPEGHKQRNQMDRGRGQQGQRDQRPHRQNRSSDESFNDENIHDYSRSQPGQRTQNRGRQVPAEALSACSGKSVGEICQIESIYGQVDGVCSNVQGSTVCQPDHSSRRGSRQNQTPVSRTPSSVPDKSGKDEEESTYILMIEPGDDGSYDRNNGANIRVLKVKKGDQIVYEITNRSKTYMRDDEEEKK